MPFSAGQRVTGAQLTDLEPLWSMKLDGPQSKTSDTALGNVTQMVVTPDINTTYRIHCLVYYTAGGTGDLKLSFTFPAGATLYWGACNYAAVGNLVSFGTQLAAASDSTLFVEGATAAHVIINGVLVMGATAGNLQLRFAQNTSNGTATQILNGSVLDLTKLP